MRRLAVAWRQMVLGLRGQDLVTELANSKLQVIDYCDRLVSLQKRAFSMPTRVVLLELLDLGVHTMPGMETEKREIRATQYEVPMALMRPVGTELVRGFAIDAALLKYDRDPSRVRRRALEDAAAEMGIALVYQLEGGAP